MAEDTQRGGGYTSFSDMFDGGGPGASGGPFKGGGLLSAVGNVLTGNRGMGVGPEAGVGFAGYGYNDAGGNWVPASVDMRNGGGPGMAGPTFMGGGHYSGILNLWGIRPMEYNATASSTAPISGGGDGPRNPILAPMSSPAPAPRPSLPANYMPVNSRVNMPVGALPMRMQFVPGVTPATPLPEDYVSSVRGINAPLVSGAPDLDALRAYLGSY